MVVERGLLRAETHSRDVGTQLFKGNLIDFLRVSDQKVRWDRIALRKTRFQRKKQINYVGGSILSLVDLSFSSKTKKKGLRGKGGGGRPRRTILMFSLVFSSHFSRFGLDAIAVSLSFYYKAN